MNTTRSATTSAMIEHGASLVEALIATLIMTTGVVTVAQLLSLSMASNVAARRGTVAAILAEQRIEQLRAEAAAGSALAFSPSSSLEQNTDGFVDHLAADGRIVGNSAPPPAQAIYTRRWSIEPVAAAPESPLVVQVLVVDRDTARRPGRTRGEARVATLATRRAP